MLIFVFVWLNKIDNDYVIEVYVGTVGILKIYNMCVFSSCHMSLCLCLIRHTIIVGHSSICLKYTAYKAKKT